MIVRLIKVRFLDIFTFRFVKHELKEVLKCIEVEIGIYYPLPLNCDRRKYGNITGRDRHLSNVPSRTMIDIPVKSNSTVGIL